MNNRKNKSNDINEKISILFIGNGFDIAHRLNIRFGDFVKWAINNKKLKSYKKYFTNRKYCEYMKDKNYWSDFEKFCFILIERNQKVKKFHLMNTISLALDEWFNKNIEKWETFAQKNGKNDFINDFIQEYKIKKIFSFNYTKTPRIYGFKELEILEYYKKSSFIKFDNKNKTFTFLHYFPSKDRKNMKMIIGYDGNQNEQSKIMKNKFIRQWNSNNKFDPKDRILDAIIENETISKIVFYGFSFGDSDFRMIDFLKRTLRRRKEVIIYCYQGKKPNSLKELKVNKKNKIKYINI